MIINEENIKDIFVIFDGQITFDKYMTIIEENFYYD